ncbi:MAG: ABC transporter ATP-binding protein [Firmicutes bacterium]|nr:ABC transporter ATP-binding protein [Bacillota bacterium]
MNLIKRFVSYYAYELPLSLLDISAAALIAVLDLLFPMITRTMMKDFIPNYDLSGILKYGIILLLMYIAVLILQYIVDNYGHIAGIRIETRMRHDLFCHMQKLDVEFFDNNRTGSLMSRIVNDLHEVSELAHHGPEDLLIATVMLVGSTIYLMQINVPLTLLIIAFVPLMIFFAIKTRKSMGSAFSSVKRQTAEINSDIESSISGIRVAKSFANEDYEKSRFQSANHSYRKAREGAYHHMAVFYSGLNFMTNLLNGAVLVFGGYLAYLGRIDLADLTAYLLFVTMFIQPIRKLTNFAQQYEQGMAGFKRFVELMETQPKIIDKEDAVTLKNVRGEVTFDRVSFGYNSHSEVIKEVSLEVEPGKTIALVGSSGGGKTTLCHLLLRFYEPDVGSIKIDDVDIQDIALASLRQTVGLVQQDVFLFAGTIKDNILYGRPDATDKEIIEAAKNAEIHDFISSLPDDYDTYVGERGIKLSGGQKQRIAIARLFLKNPPILILDEATSALDNITEYRIQNALKKLSEGRTVFLIAHRLSSVKDADEIVVLEDGEIVEKGTHMELLKDSTIYAKLYSSQYIPSELLNNNSTDA